MFVDVILEQLISLVDALPRKGRDQFLSYWVDNLLGDVGWLGRYQDLRLH